MADNVPITAGSGTNIATDDAGAGGHVQIVKLAISTDGSATVLPADAANGLDVDVTRLPALVAGTAAIGKLAANSGVDIGDVDVTSLPALVASTAAIGNTNTAGIGTAATAKTSASVTTTSSNPVAANTARKALFLSNDSGVNTIYLALGTTAIASQGIRLGPGATVVIRGDEYTGRVDAIATATSTMTISEA